MLGYSGLVRLPEPDACSNPCPGTAPWRRPAFVTIMPITLRQPASLLRHCLSLALLLLAVLLGSAGPASAASTTGGGKNFDHMTTGFPLTGQHSTIRCEDCHVRGIFKGLPAQCAACHTPGALVTAVMIPNNHIPVFQPCDTCHTTASFYGAHFVHSDVAIGTCNQCHNGVFAKGTSANHIPIGNASCDNCHTTVSFLTAYLSTPIGHIPTTQSCTVCHVNADFTPPAPGGNLAPHMNHAGTAGQCDTCHAASAADGSPQAPLTFTIPGSATINGRVYPITSNGTPVTVVPMSQSGGVTTATPGVLNHVPAKASCDQCHTNGVFTQGSAFKSGVMHHSAVSGESCSLCHATTKVFAGTSVGPGGQPTQIPGPIGTPGPANHFPINGLDCAASGCHAATDTVTANGSAFATNLTPALSSIGHQTVNLPCESCHDVGMTWRLQSGTMVTPAAAGASPQHIPPANVAGAGMACSTCHLSSSVGTGGFKLAGTPVLNIQMHSAVANAVPLCTSCHEAGTLAPGNLTFQGVLGNIYLRPNTGASGLSKGAGLDPWHGSGIGLSLDCKSCHTTTPPFSADLVAPTGHIPINSGAACADCHVNNTYVPGQTQMKHADVTATACATCHNNSAWASYLGTGQGTNGQPWQMNGAAGTLGGTSTTHFPIGATTCNSSGCHTATDVLTSNGAQFAISATPVLSASGHASVGAASSVGCETCHLSGMSWKGVTTLIVAATGTGSSGGHIPPDNATPAGVSCASCHSSAPAGFAAGGFRLTGTPVMNVNMHTAVAGAEAACTTCHEASAANMNYQGTIASGNIYLRPGNATYSGLSLAGDLYHSAAANTLGYTADCATCHVTSSFTASLKAPAGHIPLNTGAACADCHATASSYAPGASGMKHADVTATPCATCHNTSTVFLGSGQGFNGGQPWQMNGAVDSAGISTSTTHFAIGSATCNSSGCHSVVDTAGTGGGANGAGFKIAVASGASSLTATGHAAVGAGTALTCASCHTLNVATQTSTALWKGTTVVGLSTLHIPVNSGVACTTCHSNATSEIAGAFVLPTKNGTGAGAALSPTMHSSVSNTACDSCHDYSVNSGVLGFQGVGSNIYLRPASANPGLSYNAATDPFHAQASLATGQCNVCHTTTGPFNGNAVPTSGHITINTGAPCADCHKNGYAPGLTGMKHADVSTNCVSCHNTGTAFLGTAQGVDGQPWQMSGAVDSGGISTSTNHFPIGSANCNSSGCHSLTNADIPTTNGAQFKLTASSGSVFGSTGHAAVGAGTSLACSSCHVLTSSTSPSAALWKGVSTVGQATLHIGFNANVACTTCHTGSTGYAVGSFVLSNKHGLGASASLTGALHSNVSASCDNCHESSTANLSFQGVDTYIFLRPGTAAASGQSLVSDTAHQTGSLGPGNVCSSCHTTTGPFTDTTLPTGHFPVNSGVVCTDCHTGGYGAGQAVMKHADVTSTACATCHNTSTVYLGTAQGTGGQPWQMNGAVDSGGISTSTTHFPIGSAGCNGSGCHATTNADTMTTNGAGFVVAATSGSSVLSSTGHATAGATAANCNTCHVLTSAVSPSNASYKGVNLVGQATAHIAFNSGTQCGTCHTSASGYALNGFVMTNKGATGASAVLSASLHSYVSTSCDNCHEASAANLGFQGVAGTIYLRPNNGANSGLSLATDASHVGTAATASCGNSGCHTTTGPFQGIPTGHIPIATGAVCTSCHTTAGSYTSVVLPMPHTSVTGTCLSCHSSSTLFAGSTFTPTAGVGQTGGTFGTQTTGTNFQAKQFPTGHIPISTGDCGACHSSTSTFVLTGTVGTATPLMTPTMHTAVSALACQTCHEQAGSATGDLSFYGVAGNIILRPGYGTSSGYNFTAAGATLSTQNDTPHAAGGEATGNDCAGCHTTTPPFANGTGVPSGHIPIATGASCTACHTTAGSYANVVLPMPHTSVTGTCISCHQNTTPYAGSTFTPTSSSAGSSGGTFGTQTTGANFVAKQFPTSGHIPTSTADCGACHVSTNGTFVLSGTVGTAAPLMTPTMHTAVSSLTCATCHEQAGITAGNLTFFGVSSNIILRPGYGNNSGDLGAYKASGATNTIGADTPHASGSEASGDCAACHTTTPPFANGAALPTGHIAIVSGASCTVCHTTGDFSQVVQPLPHTGYVSGTCASCHYTSTKFAGSTFTPAASGGGGTYTASSPATALNFSPKQIVSSPALGASGGHIPLPSSDDCSVCHAVPTATLDAFGPGTAMVHTGITGNCAQCHTSGASWYGEKYVATPLIKNGGTAIGTPVHVPLTNLNGVAADCSVCHSATVFTNFGTTTTVNHTTTFMSPTSSNGKSGGLAKPSCVSCHAPSGTKWYGTSLSTETMGSHQSSSSSQDCINCHSASKFAASAAAAAVAHRPEIRASSGPAVRPGGIPPRATSGGTLTGTSSASTSATASASSAGDPAASQLPAPVNVIAGGAIGRRFDLVAGGYTHLDVVPGTCANCHSPAGGATPKPANHLPTNLSCDACHRTTAWIPAMFLHAGVSAGTCASCHTGAWATSKPANHMITARSCDTCHSTAAWTPQTYTHADTVYSPHADSVTCVQCHKSNTEQVVWTYPALKPGCGGCHGPQFQPTSHREGRAVMQRR